MNEDRHSIQKFRNSFCFSFPNSLFILGYAWQLVVVSKVHIMPRGSPKGSDCIDKVAHNPTEFWRKEVWQGKGNNPFMSIETVHKTLT